MSELYREDYSHVLDRSGVRVTTGSTPGAALGRPKAIISGEQVAGVVACRPEEARRVEDALEGAGYRVTIPEPPPAAAEREMELGHMCGPEPEESRPCDVDTAAETVRGLAEDAGISTAPLDDLIDKRVTEDQVIDAMQQVVDQMAPGSWERLTGQDIVDIIRSGEPLGLEPADDGQGL